MRSCRVDVAAPASRWRLTDRGIAVVLVLAVMITVAAVTVIGLTAWQVTGAGLPADGGVGTGCDQLAVTTTVRMILSAKVCLLSSHSGQR